MDSILTTLTHAWLALAAFINDHPAVTAYILGALLTYLCKPKTAAQYARIAKVTPRGAALLQLVGSLNLDPMKFAAAFVKLMTGTAVPESLMARIADLPPTGGGDNATPIRLDSIDGDADTPPMGTEVRKRARPRNMRLLLAAATMALSLALTGCPTSLTPEKVHAAETITKSAVDEACVLANAFFPKGTIAKVCKLAQPIVDQVLASQRAAGVSATPRTLPVTCEDRAGVIVCDKVYIELVDGGAP